MRKLTFYGMLGVFVLILFVLFYTAYLDSKPEPVKSNTNSTPAIKINYSNIETQLSKNSIVKSIPADNEILLQFYNFNSGERTIEKAYTLRSSGVKLTNKTEAEIILLLSSKYLENLTNKNLCSVMEKANKNGDLGMETNLSSVELAWKFKSMREYKDCFGL